MHGTRMRKRRLAGVFAALTAALALVFSGGFAGLPEAGAAGEDVIKDPGLKKCVNRSISSDRPATQAVTARELETLRGIRLSDCYGLEPRISNLEGLQHATNLERLSLTFTTVSDVSALAGLTNLEALDLWDNDVSDVSALAGLTRLESLNLSDNSVSDVSALAGLTNLEHLDLAGNSVSDVSALAGLTKLERLVVGGNRLTDLRNLKAATARSLVSANWQRGTVQASVESGTTTYRVGGVHSAEDAPISWRTGTLRDVSDNQPCPMDQESVAGRQCFVPDGREVTVSKDGKTVTVAADMSKEAGTVLYGGFDARSKGEDGEWYGAVGSFLLTPSFPGMVSGIAVSGPAKVNARSAIQLQASVTPANAANKAVTWKSSDTKIATVDANGKVTGVKAGTVTITATAKDGSNVSGSLKVTVTQPAAAGPASFRDVPVGHPFVKDIAWLSQRGITTGWADGTFRPRESVSRAAFAAFLYRMAGCPAYTPSKASPFPDVKVTHPFYKEISWMAAKGVTTGYRDGTFRPEAKIHRDALSTFLYRFAGNPKFAVSKSFRDTARSEHRTAIDWFASTGISTGWSDGTFRPHEETERGAIAAFLHRFSDKGISIAVR